MTSVGWDWLLPSSSESSSQSGTGGRMLPGEPRGGGGAQIMNGIGVRPS